MPEIRPPAVAGTFYPFAASELRREIEKFVAEAAPGGPDARDPKVLIVPHAGYIYSGSIAGSAYARIASLKDSVQRVVLLGPAHRVRLRGLALPAATGFATPLGTVSIDTEAAATVRGFEQVIVSDEAHALEHSLEVQLPFLQSVLGEFRLVPFAVGDVSPQQVAEVLDALWDGPETLIVISSDLSHYLPYPNACAKDEFTAETILRLQPELDHQQACGATPINGLLLAARERGLEPRLLDLRNSGDTAGDKSRVVGYAAFSFHEPEEQPFRTSDGRHEDCTDRGNKLLQIARAAIADNFGINLQFSDSEAFLHEHGASFVTLRDNGTLRGCIGTLQAHRTVLEDVRQNAFAAAFRDPRFKPLRPDEYERITVEVSLLSALSPIQLRSESEAIAQLRPGIDGVVLQCGASRGTFLPQVWDSLPEPARFLNELKRKAGLPADFWSEEIKLYRYHVDKWTEDQSSVTTGSQ